MIRCLALALTLLVPGLAAATEPPPASQAVLSAASHRIVGSWVAEEPLDHPEHGPGTAHLTLEFRPDGTLGMVGRFAPDANAEPPSGLTFRMTAGWWMEDASDLRLRVRLEDVTVFQAGEAPRPGDPELTVMNLLIGPDGSLTDRDDGTVWSRQGGLTSPPLPPSP